MICENCGTETCCIYIQKDYQKFCPKCSNAMYRYSHRSTAKLLTCHIGLQKLFNEIIKHYDCKILCGFRDRATQNQAFDEGRSQVDWPHSKHNNNPSTAIDVAPYPLDWEDIKRWYMFIGIVRGFAAKMNIPIRCGADWDGDMQIKDQNFHDLPHIEIIII